MKKLHLLTALFLILGLFQLLFSQTKLFRINQETAKDIEFVSPNDGWMITGDFIQKTTDGGNSWEIMLTLDRDKYYCDLVTYSYDFVDNKTAFFTDLDKTTYEYFLFSTTDGGNSWQRKSFLGDNIDRYSTANIKGVTFLNSNYGLAIYKSSKIIGTTDGGNSWKILYEGNLNLQKIRIADALKVWAISYDAVIKTTDGGATWTNVQTNLATYFSDISVVGSRTWLGTNNGVVYSSDGINWSLINTDYHFGNVSYIKMADENYGIADGYCTTDGGNTWTSKFNKSLSGTVSIYDKNNCWYWSTGKAIDKLSNGFEKVETVWPELLITDICIVNNNIIVASTSTGSIIKSADGGKTWRWIKDLYTQFNIQDICFANENNGIAVGNYYPQSSYYPSYAIAVTDDAGETWQIVLNETPEYQGATIGSADYTSGNYVAKSTGRIIRSIDSGHTWSIDSTDLYAAFMQTDFVGNTGLGLTNMGVLYKSLNLGVGWTKVTESFISSVYYLSDGLIWAVLSGDIYKSTDVGNTWINTNLGFEGVYFKNSDLGIGNGYVVYGDGSTYGTYLTTDGGQTWDKLIDKNISSQQNHSIDVISSTKGFIAQRYDFYTLQKYGDIDTTGSGNTEQKVIFQENFDGSSFPPDNWSLIQNHSTNTWAAGNVKDHYFTSVDPNSVNSAICPWINESQDEWLISPEFSLADGEANVDFYAGYSTEWLSAASLKLHVSTNSGTSWTQIWEAVNDGSTWSWHEFNVDLTEYADKNNLKLAWQYVGQDGDIVAVDNISLTGFVNTTEVEENILLPDQFSLEQNYPNPFNPSTNIKFNIAEQCFVSLKVYDITGQEIKTLINNEMKAGTYDVMFNAENITSGIYFITLRTDKFAKTIKSVLLR